MPYPGGATFDFPGQGVGRVKILTHQEPPTRVPRVLHPDQERAITAAPGDGFWSKMRVLVFFMTAVSCKSLTNYVHGKFLTEMIRGRRARLYGHDGEQITGFGGSWAGRVTRGQAQ